MDAARQEAPQHPFHRGYRHSNYVMASNPDAADMAGLMHARGRDKDRASLAETAIVPRAEVESRLKMQRELLTQIRNSVKREILRRLEVAGACRSSEDHRRWENVSPSPDGLETLEGDSDTGGLTLEEANEQLTNAGVDVGALFRERLPAGGHKLVQSIKSLEARLCPPKADAATPGSAPARAAEPVIQDVGAIYEVPPSRTCAPCQRRRAISLSPALRRQVLERLRELSIEAKAAAPERASRPARE